MDFLIEFLLIPLVFWSLSAIMFVALIMHSETNRLWSGIWLIIFGGVLWTLKYGSVAGLWEYVTDNPVKIVISAILYVIVGTIWSLFKWYLYVIEEAQKDHSYVPRPEHEKDMIVTWIILWPPSTIWFVINDPIRRIGEFIHNQLKEVYKGIAVKTFEKHKRRQDMT